MTQWRKVDRVVAPVAAMDGAGVRLMRTIGTPALELLDPFLLLDEFRSDDSGDYIAGFPDHPHRGFETVTYMIDGRMRHEDNQGSAGVLRSGGVQWMTAGRGIIHSEMPEQSEGLMHGFQLWVNLPARDKMAPPRYQNLEPEEVPLAEPAPGVRVRVVAGTVAGTEGAVSGIAVAPIYLDIALDAGAAYEAEVPAGHAAFCHVIAGPAGIAESEVATSHVAVLGPGAAVRLHGLGGPARLLLVAGRPIGEPVARYGPFVMNTVDELRQAFADYQSGRF